MKQLRPYFVHAFLVISVLLLRSLRCRLPRIIRVSRASRSITLGRLTTIIIAARNPIR
jgi:hypothetical protein